MVDISHEMVRILFGVEVVALGVTADVSETDERPQPVMRANDQV